jgi:hypothetical protein
MMVLLNEVSRVSINAVDATAATGTGETAAETVAATQDLAINVASLGDPIALIFWGIAVLAFVCIWYQLSKPAYAPRRYDQVRKGPFTRFHDAFVNSVGVFLP